MHRFYRQEKPMSGTWETGSKTAEKQTLTGERMFTGEITGGMKNERRED